MVGRWVLAMAVMLAIGTTARLDARAAPGVQQSKTATAAAPLVNLNAATTADLQKLPGVGASMASRIIEYRQKNGGFKKIEELMNVKGIGEKNFLKLKTMVTVAPPKVAER